MRYRPTLKRIPSEANLRRARKQLEEIKARIANGTFCFAEEFPDYRDLGEVVGAGKRRTCNDVFDEFIKRCESRMEKNDLAFATLDSYRKILDAIWRPAIGAQDFESVKYSTLVKIADARSIGKKTYNNIISPLRSAFQYGYRDHPEKHSPATGLKGFRITKKDRPVVDPFTINEAEALIAAIHRDWGEAQGNYDEFRFFTGLRPSEQIALRVTDCDLVQGKISVTKARVMARDKDRTKTSEDRLVELPESASRTEEASCPARRTEAPGEDRSRRPLLQGRRYADPQPPVPVDPVEEDPTADEGALPRTVQRAPLVRELESHDRQEPVVGRQAARAQRANDARGLCGLDGGREGSRYRSN